MLAQILELLCCILLLALCANFSSMKDASCAMDAAKCLSVSLAYSLVEVASAEAKPSGTALNAWIPIFAVDVHSPLHRENGITVELFA